MFPLNFRYLVNNRIPLLIDSFHQITEPAEQQIAVGQVNVQYAGAEEKQPKKEEAPTKVAVKRKSILDRFGETLKEFLDNA